MSATFYLVVTNLKNPTIIVTSCLVFGNLVSNLQWAGFALAFFGAYGYGKWGKESKVGGEDEIATKGGTGKNDASEAPAE